MISPVKLIRPPKATAAAVRIDPIAITAMRVCCTETPRCVAYSSPSAKVLSLRASGAEPASPTATMAATIANCGQVGCVTVPCSQDERICIPAPKS